MPAIFLHSFFAYLINRWKPQFSLPPLLVGSMLPDIEVIPIYYLTNGTIDRLILHSIIGAFTIGTILSVGIVLFIYPSIVSHFFKIDINDIKKKCCFSITLIGLCMIGNLSHVLVDATTHEYNPLAYPISSESIDFLRISTNRNFDNIVLTVVLSIILLGIVIVSMRKGRKGFWKQMLVG